MSARDDLSEQPRKKARLTGPEDASTSSNRPWLAGREEDIEAQTPIIASEQDPTKAQSEQERNAGITVWATDAPGFAGIVKKRYTDFLVNEILPNRQVLHLVDIAKPEKKAQQPHQKKEKKGQKAAAAVGQAGEGAVQEASVDKKAENGDSTDPDAKLKNIQDAAIAAIPEADIKILQNIFGEKTVKDMCAIYGKVCAKPDRKARDFHSVQSEIIIDKQKRTDAHIATRRIFSGYIETMTGDDNSILIKACPAAASTKPKQNNPSQPGSQPRGKVGWDELGGQFLHFTLYKENKDTMEVLYFIASQLKLAVKNFSFAGTKDRRGVTVQRVAGYRIPKERLQNLNHQLRAARIGHLHYQHEALELGDLYGNEFTITLRDCAFPDEPSDAAAKLQHAKQIVDKALTGFQTTGFINYYGLQRFGSFSIGTDEVGKRMLQGDLEAAVNLLCAYSPEALAAAQKLAAANGDESAAAEISTKISSDDMARAEALHIWETTGKMGPALDKLPRRFQAENAIIRHLGFVDKKTGAFKRRRDWQGALMGISRNLRLMYVHAYQSLVWNMAAGKRWQEFGRQVVEGDLVLVHEHKDKELKVEEEVLEDVDADGEVIIRPAADDAATTEEERFERARALTKEEVGSGKYNIFDIVLPLPGYDVVYPPNSIGQYYKDFMASEKGGKLNPLDMRRKWKDISLSGGYRKMMARPEEVSWEVKSYKADDEQMVETDLEKLIGRDEANKTRSAAASGYCQAEGADVKMEEEPKQEAEEREQIAVVLKMQLGSSQYATMALRELTKGGAITFRPDFHGAR
ncbi:pseudouridine synthase [Delphinella strobiligena]|nr:pseudouridine synthase [Delphinella strobiligena]